MSQYVSRGEMFEVEWATYRRCFPAQPILSALQRYNRRKRAHLLRDLATTVDLPPHSALFSLQLLDLAHRWSEREDNDFHIFDVLPLAATVYISWLRLNPPPAPDRQQPARPLADLLAASAGLLAWRQPHNAPSLQQVVTEEYRILEVLGCELATHTPAAWIDVFKQRLSLWCQQQLQQSQRPLLSLVSPDVFAHAAQGIAEVYVRDQPFTVVSRPSHVGASAWSLSCAFWICLPLAGVYLR